MIVLQILIALNVFTLLLLLLRLSKLRARDLSELKYEEQEEKSKEIARRLMESTYSIKLIRVSAADVLLTYQRNFIMGLEPNTLENLVTCKWSLHGPYINVSDPNLRQNLISPLIINDVIVKVPKGRLREGQLVIGPNFGMVLRHLDAMK